ncbi:unnamed protein product [Gadus morhua 'NCC']
MVKPQSQHSGGRGVEQAGCSYAGDGEASWTAPGVNSSLTGQQWCLIRPLQQAAGSVLCPELQCFISDYQLTRDAALHHGPEDSDLQDDMDAADTSIQTPTTADPGSYQSHRVKSMEARGFTSRMC